MQPLRPCERKINSLKVSFSAIHTVEPYGEFAFKGHSTKTCRNFSNFNRENVRRDISRQDWSCTSDDPNVLWADWKAKFLSIVNSHASIKTKRVRSGKVPWITSDLRKGMRDRDVAKRKAIKSNNPQDWAMYKRLRNRINGEVKSTKASYYASAFIQSNGYARKTWQLINELTSRQKNNASVKELKLNENSVPNSHELSNAFNDHFSTIGTKLATLFFFYKNIFHKNVEAEICEILRIL